MGLLSVYDNIIIDLYFIGAVVIIRIPLEIQTELITGFYIILAIIIFLWGKAIGFNESSEKDKQADKKGEILQLRRENKLLQFKNKELMSKNKMYMNTMSGLRHLLRKGE